MPDVTLKVNLNGTWIGELGTRVTEPTRRENARGSPIHVPSDFTLIPDITYISDIWNVTEPLFRKSVEGIEKNND